MSKELWCCHISGTDDVIACPDWWVAAEMAHVINGFCREPYLRMPSDDWPRMWASPTPWPHDESSHAASLSSDGGDFGHVRLEAIDKLNAARALFQ